MKERELHSPFEDFDLLIRIEVGSGLVMMRDACRSRNERTLFIS